VTILEEELKRIQLHVGDIVIQRSTGYVGILMEKFQKFPPGYIAVDVMEDIYFWRIEWLKNITRNHSTLQKIFLNPVLEEEGLKMSIMLGNIEHYPNESFKEDYDEI
tara:strand:+ start:7708 stop:8028 length:321 start_codon:yes stop_codon:yes gene_type:complete